MFFMMGIMSGRKELKYDRLVICDLCGKYGRYQVYMTYMVFSLFFIPIFKWNKKYYVTSTCCGATYALDELIGRRLARGDEVEINPEDLQLISGGNRGISERKECEHCGYSTEEDFEFCPKCGKKL